MKLPSEKTPIEVFFTDIGNRSLEQPGYIDALKRLCLPLPYWLLSHLFATPGLFFHRYVIQFAFMQMLKGRCSASAFRQMIDFPMDSVRYFEFDFMWKSLIKEERYGCYLDISSPRYFPLLALLRHLGKRATIVNPDKKDLDVTQALFDSCGLSRRCNFLCSQVDELNLDVESFDFISTISVLEHIPECGDSAAVEKMWELLRPGGRLLISVPCALSAAEEFLNINEYNLLRNDDMGYVFGQRFYNEDLLDERIFSVTGPPVRVSVYGEKERGFFHQNRDQKNCNPSYPFWREPYMMGKNAQFYESIKDLPGWGVVAMEFRKQ